MRGQREKRCFVPDLSADEIAEIQLQGLRWTVGHAMASPQLRAKLSQAGVEAGDIRSLDDLASLPFTDAEDLREGYPLPMLAAPEKDVVRVHASSGTTGKRKVLAYTANDAAAFATQMARCYELAGLTEMDRM